LGVNLNAYLGLDARISDSFRTHSSISFKVPDENNTNADFYLQDFYIDYNVLNRVFFRVGKFSHNWGSSPNFLAANLLSRLPVGNTGGDSYILKMDVPIGIGGLQFLALTRPGFITGTTPGFNEIGFGGKYNLAFTWVDIDMGAFYHEEMPLRGSASIKTTVKDTEVYLEAMGAILHETWDGFSYSLNFGVAQSFFEDIFKVNAEIFWNGEDDAYYFNPRTELVAEKASPFVPGLNLAFNLSFKPGWIWNLRFALTSRWVVPRDEAPFSAYVLPGLIFSPFSHIDVSLGFPVALGSREGAYYRNNADVNSRPFGVALLINLKGDYHVDYYK
jgi:hypothetical protein